MLSSLGCGCQDKRIGGTVRIQQPGGRSSFLTVTPPARQIQGSTLSGVLSEMGHGHHGRGGRNKGWGGPYYGPYYGPYAPPPLCIQPDGQMAPCGQGPVVISEGSPAILMGGLGRMGRMGCPSPRPMGRLAGGLSAPPFKISHLADGTFTEDTIANMHKAVLAAKTDSKWRQMMEDIRQAGRRAGQIGWKDYLGELRWMDHWYRVVHPIDYVRDPHQVELVMHPMLTYQKGLGDCDDSSTLMAASMGALGAAHKFRTYKADPRRRDEWSHVVAQIWVPGHGWVNDDLTLEGAPVGFEPTGFEYKDWLEPLW